MSAVDDAVELVVIRGEAAPCAKLGGRLEVLAVLEDHAADALHAVVEPSSALARDADVNMQMAMAVAGTRIRPSSATPIA